MLYVSPFSFPSPQEVRAKKWKLSPALLPAIAITGYYIHG
jgi:hypothetical protein